MCKKSKFPLVFNIFLAFFITLVVTIFVKAGEGALTPESFIIGMIQGFCLNMTLETIIDLPAMGNKFVRALGVKKMEGPAAYFLRLLAIVFVIVLLMSFLLMFCEIGFAMGAGFFGFWITKATITQREAPKARARRHREPAVQDSLKKDSIRIVPSKELVPLDSLSAASIQIADSLDAANKKELKKIEQPASIMVKADSVPPAKDINKKIFIPNPTKATWLAVVFPGGGQIYNRKYWKLPIIYGGFAGCAYALSWNGKMYKDYSQAYLDIMDSNPNTKSYEDLLPPNATYNEEQLKNTIKRRKDMFRRYRDLSIFAFIGVYLISIIDAYVDAELSNFDITPDLSMKVEPAVIDNNNQFRSTSLKNKSVGLQCVLRF